MCWPGQDETPRSVSAASASATAFTSPGRAAGRAFPHRFDCHVLEWRCQGAGDGARQAQQGKTRGACGQGGEDIGPPRNHTFEFKLKPRTDRRPAPLSGRKARAYPKAGCGAPASGSRPQKTRGRPVKYRARGPTLKADVPVDKSHLLKRN